MHASSPALRNASILTAWVQLLLACAACCSCKADRPVETMPERRVEVRLIPAGGAPIRILAEIAFTEDERRKGLMFREKLGENEGMLFVFQEEAEHPFWMKNTRIPLDMLFLDAKRTVVGILRSTAPMNEKSLTVGVASRYVLEVPGGFCDRHGIHRGDAVDFQF